MGLLSFLKPKKQQQTNERYAYTQVGMTPIFTKFGESVYASDTVQQAINAIAKEMKKLDPHHIRINGLSRQIVNGDIDQALQNPNEYMTTSDFIEKCIWILYLTYNCYIYPKYEVAVDSTGRYYKKYIGFYPLNPTQVTYYEDDLGNISNIKMEFPKNKELIVPYTSIIHLRLNYAMNDYEGGDKYGKPNNEALLKTLKINHVLLESIGKSIETSYSVNGIMKYNTMLDDGTMAEKIDKFNDALENSKSGILGTDMKGEYINIPRDIKVVDKDTLEFLDLKVLRNYGVPIEILNGTATAEQKRSFYETTLEPLIVSLNQAFTKVLFSQQKINGGNKIEFYFNRLETMTNQQKSEMVKDLGERGALTNNMMLEIYGLPPYEGGDIRLMSLNYVNVDIANQYQLNNAGAKTATNGNGMDNEPTNDDNNQGDKDTDYTLKMLIKAGISEEDAKKIMEEDNEEN